MNLVPSFGRSLFEAWVDPALDTLELGLDGVLENPVLRSLPLVQYFAAAGRTALAVRDQFFISKTIGFLREFARREAKEEEIARRKAALGAGESWVYRELEFLILTLERTDRAEKTKILSELYHDYLDGKMSRLLFEDCCSITERLFLLDILQLRADYEALVEEEGRKGAPPVEWYVSSRTFYPEQQGRLLSLGLLIATAKVHSGVRADENLLGYALSPRGKRYGEILSRLDFLGMTAEMLGE